MKLRFADLPAGTQAALSGAQAISSTFRFREIGGARGSAVVNALYGITADSAAVTARLGGTGRDVYLATGRPDDGFNILPLANAGVAGARQDFSGFDPGDDVKASGLFTSTKSDVTALAVPDISGLDDGPALEIQSPTLSGFRDTDPQYEVFFSQDTRMDGTQGLLLYIKCGGEYVFSNLSDNGNNLATINLSLEEFYAGAKDADVLIYNSTIEGKIETTEQLLSKCPMLADFKAVQNGNVWCTTQSLFQESMELPDLILDMNRVFAAESPNAVNEDELKFLTHVS